MGTLYIVGTPIGNLGDLSPRAANVLRNVALVAAEDTRVSRKILQLVGSTARITSCHQHNLGGSTKQIMAVLRESNVALVTDAGMPAISDPGTELVSVASAEGHMISTIPGPSAVTSALAVSGLSSSRFTFLGFLPRRRTERILELEEIAGRPETIVCFETPHRLRSSLKDMSSVLGDRQIVVCRELTKIHEEIFRGTAEAALEYFRQPRGEMTVVIAGAEKSFQQISDAEIEASRERMSAAGISGRNLVAAVVASTGASRRRVYRLVLDKRDKSSE